MDTLLAAVTGAASRTRPRSAVLIRCVGRGHGRLIYARTSWMQELGCVSCIAGVLEGLLQHGQPEPVVVLDELRSEPQHVVPGPDLLGGLDRCLDPRLCHQAGDDAPTLGRRHQPPEVHRPAVAEDLLARLVRLALQADRRAEHLVRTADHLAHGPGSRDVHASASPMAAIVSVSPLRPVVVVSLRVLAVFAAMLARSACAAFACSSARRARSSATFLGSRMKRAGMPESAAVPRAISSMS